MTSHPEPFRAGARATGRAAALLFVSFGLGLGGCTTLNPTPVASQECQLAEARASFEARSRRAERIRSERLEREIQRLRVDLHQAEIAMLATDSEARPGRNRASAVSMLAEARIALEQAERSVSWNLGAVQEGQQKLAEAERQLKAGRPKAAAYFASRAQHIADLLIAQALRVEQSPDARFVKSAEVNVRAGPSIHEAILLVVTQGTPIFFQRAQGPWLQVRTLNGQVGWVYRSLIREP